MRAIILAAGRGARLEAAGLLEPKCLLELGGATLLDRHLRNLDALGVRDVRVCVGYRADLVEAALAAAPAGLTVEAVENPDFREGSVVSLWTTRDAMDGSDEVLVMDADVLYAPAILERLVASPSATALLVDRDFVPGDEPVKVCLKDGAVVEFSKRVPPGLAYDAWGESVGFFKLSPERAVELAQRCDAYVRGGRRGAPHEAAIRDMVLDDPYTFAVEDVTGLPWIEIDFPEDVARARDVILPRVESALRAAGRA
jgi:choline kinase